MSNLLIILFIISIVFVLIGITVMFKSRKPGITVSDMYWKGSYIFRNLEDYVLPERISLIKTLNLIGVSCFLIFVTGILYVGFLIYT